MIRSLRGVMGRLVEGIESRAEEVYRDGVALAAAAILRQPILAPLWEPGGHATAAVTAWCGSVNLALDTVLCGAGLPLTGARDGDTLEDAPRWVTDFSHNAFCCALMGAIAASQHALRTARHCRLPFQVYDAVGGDQADHKGLLRLSNIVRPPPGAPGASMDDPWSYVWLDVRKLLTPPDARVRPLGARMSEVIACLLHTGGVSDMCLAFIGSLLELHTADPNPQPLSSEDMGDYFRDYRTEWRTALRAAVEVARLLRLGCCVAALGGDYTVRHLADALTADVHAAAPLGDAHPPAGTPPYATHPVLGVDTPGWRQLTALVCGVWGPHAAWGRRRPLVVAVAAKLFVGGGGLAAAASFRL